MRSSVSAQRLWVITTIATLITRARGGDFHAGLEWWSSGSAMASSDGARDRTQLSVVAVDDLHSHTHEARGEDIGRAGRCRDEQGEIWPAVTEACTAPR